MRCRWIRVTVPAHSARNILLNPTVDAAVFEQTARGGLLREGLLDHADVAVVTNIGVGDHLGLNFITTVDDLAVLKRVIVRNVAKNGYAVLNAADPIIGGHGDTVPRQGDLFAADPEHPVITSHKTQGGRVVYVHNGDVVAMKGAFETRLPLAGVPDPQRHYRFSSRKRDGFWWQQRGAWG